MSQATSETKPARPTVRDHIERLVDPGSFVPAAHVDEQAGQITSAQGGEALIDGRPVTLGYAGHLLQRALNREHPYIAISSGTGGLARGGPRNLGVLDPVWGMSGGPMMPEMLSRMRGVPVVSALVHHSFGDSSFFTGLSDYVVQLRGTCMALTSPRVLAIGTSEQVTMEELGGVDVHRHNGQADTVADTLDEVYAAIRRILSFLPSCGSAPLPVSTTGPEADRSDGIRPGPGSGNGMRQLIAGVCDAQSFFELRRDFAPSLITGLARLGGIPVGLMANEPEIDDGAYTADACLKATRLMCTCDSFGLPVIFLVDSPGPRPSAISRAMMLAQAVQQAQVPKCWVILRKAAGAGLLITGPARIATDLVVAWRGAVAGYYDDGYESAGSVPAEAQHWAPDGVIQPGQTRATLLAHLGVVVGSAPVSRPGPLRTWPVGF
jgi:acetyl-CoA carboxylase carboxyltransferase component